MDNIIPSPKTEEIVGQNEALERLRKAILESRPCVLVGEPGVGKTSSVYALARELGYKVFEINASDERSAAKLERILKKVRMKGFEKTVFLFDEADGLKNEELLRRILEESRHPIILTANEVRKIPKIKNLEVVRFETPKLTEVVKVVKRLEDYYGVRANCSNITGDVRSSILTSFFGSEKYKAKSELDRVKDVFEGRNREANRDLLIWLMENITNFYWGKEVYEVAEILALADLYGTRILKELPKGRGEAKFPRFLLRLSGMKSYTER